MSHALLELFLFSMKSIILLLFILILLAGILSIITRGKEKLRGKIYIKNLNKKFLETMEEFSQEILPKKQFKQFIKKQKEIEKSKKDKDPNKQKNIFVLQFQGDLKASAVNALREEVTAILNIATPKDEIVVRLESAGGMVHAYGLATAQLLRIREKRIPLIITVDKIAASGGYMMACVANKILAAPFAIIGSIGVIVQLPNFNRFLKNKHIDFEQITAGNYKRTLTLFGHNTEEDREKMHQDLEEIHQLFKNLIQDYRKELDIEKIATGEHWLGKQALDLKLIDEIQTSDEYLLTQSKQAEIYEVRYHAKKSFGEKLTATANALKEVCFL